LAIECDVDLIQIREKDLTTRELLQLAVEARELVQGRHSRILVNDRLDVALAARLDGVHLGQHSVLPGPVRDRVPESDFLIGVSVHSIEELRQVEDQGVSFVTMGPVFFTPSKAMYGAPVGLDLLRSACLQTRVPVLALGGIDLENSAACLDAGAAGIAAIRLFQNAGYSIKQVMRQLSSSLPRDKTKPGFPLVERKGD
jgi:thiamine-phosphate pyrophosphorylase